MRYTDLHGWVWPSIGGRSGVAGGVGGVGAPPRRLEFKCLTFTTATQSAAFNGKTKFIRAYGDAAFNILFGASPTATATSPRYAASTEYFFAVEPGDKLSVYDGTS
jgi:hypothetical protein